MTTGLPRRHFLTAVAAGSVAAGSVAAGSVAAGSVAAGSVAAGSVAAAKATAHQPAAADPSREVRLERLWPREIEAAMQACGTLFQPLGTVEWHGLHNIVGLDAIKAQHLCVRAAQRGGGLVAPPVYGGVGGVDQPHTFVIEPDTDVHSVLLRGWLERLAREAVRQGFRAVVFLTGHYGADQQMVVRDTAVRLSRALGIPVLGTPEYFLALDVGYHGDHAAWGETALMLYLDPASVDLSRLGTPPHQGVGGRDPREATVEDGKLLAETIIGRLAQLAARMPQWDRATLQRFIAAEAALVNRQVGRAAENRQSWAAWQHIGAGVFNDYGRLLADEQFEAIAELTGKL